jgi:hypothetical protein
MAITGKDTMTQTQVHQTHGAAPVETATEARQGVTGHGVRGVLLWGTATVIVAFVVVYFIFFAGGSPPAH